MTVLRISLLALAVAAVSGCQTAQVYKFDKSRTVAAGFDDTWARVIRFFSTNTLPVQTMEKASGLIVAKSERASPPALSPVASCPSALGISPRTGEMSYNVLVEPIDATQTRVTVNMAYAMTYLDFGNELVTYPCNSNGEAEKRVLDAIVSGG